MQIPHQNADSAPIGGKNHQLEGQGEGEEGERKIVVLRTARALPTLAVKKRP